MALEGNGFLRRPSGLSDEWMAAAGEAGALCVASAGTRNLLDASWCRGLAAALRTKLAADGLLPSDAVAVQCTFFNKTPARNWKVPLHQDLSVPVASHSAHPRLTGWSGKEGRIFVQAPDTLLGTMLAVRLHLDDCPADNGPLRVVPGSHHLGRLDAERIGKTAAGVERTNCVANAGDVLLMRPLLLHGSSRATRPAGMRRVLHFLFGPADPGFGLRWGVAA